MQMMYRIVHNHYEDNLCELVGQYLANENLTDITFVCKDNRKVSAHKIVLISSSEFFRTLCLDRFERHMTIVIPDINSVVMTALLRFLYEGQTFLATVDEVREFSSAVTMLGLKLPAQMVSQLAMFDKDVIVASHPAVSSEQPVNEDKETEQDETLASIMQEGDSVQYFYKVAVPQSSATDSAGQDASDVSYDSSSHFEDAPDDGDTEDMDTTENKDGRWSEENSATDTSTTTANKPETDWTSARPSGVTEQSPSTSTPPPPQCMFAQSTVEQNTSQSATEGVVSGAETPTVLSTHTSTGAAQLSDSALLLAVHDYAKPGPVFQPKLIQHDLTGGGVTDRKWSAPISRLFRCELCDAKFKFRAALACHRLEEHQRGNEPSSGHTCRDCGKTFNQRSYLLVHRRTHTLERPYRCPVCAKCFTQKSHLNDHVRTHDGSKPYQCTLCLASFCQSSALKRHLLVHTRERPCVCDVCGVGYRDKTLLEDHRRTHSGERPFRCVICSARFARRALLARHLKRCAARQAVMDSTAVIPVTDEQPAVVVMRAKVEMLDKGTAEEARLEFGASEGASPAAATLRAKPVHVEPMECYVCHKKFTLRADLNEHKKLHPDYKPYVCTQCGKRFLQAHNLTVHLRTHSGTRPYHCERCNKRFTQKSHLNDHRKSHDGVKAYSCTDCNASFVQSSSLKRHALTHTGQRPHVCSDCSATYPDRAALTVHRRLKHTGERPYACAQCPEAFVKRSHLASHVRSHDGQKEFACVQCDKSYWEKASLKVHVASCHSQ